MASKSVTEEDTHQGSSEDDELSGKILGNESEQERIAIRTLVQTHGVNGLAAYFAEKMNDWNQIPLKIAITGLVKSGKSTLINTFRNLLPEDEGAAVVNVIECTNEATPYPDPQNSNLVWYDLPGMGTLNHPRETYLEKQQLEQYDVILIITKDTFTQDDWWLATKLTEMKKQFYFVRTRIDEAVVNDKRDHPRTFNLQTLLDRIRANCLENQKDIVEKPQVYLISGLCQYTSSPDYDFGKLNEQIIQKFPKSKRKALIFSLSSNCKEVIEAKGKALKNHAQSISRLTAAVALIPFPGLSLGADVVACVSAAKFYRQQFGLTNETVKQLSQIYGPSVETFHNEINAIIPALDPVALNKRVNEVTVKGQITNVGLEVFIRCLPVIGSFISVATVDACLTDLLDRMMNAAFKVIDIINKSILDNEVSPSP